MKTIQECKSNLKEVSMKDFYLLCEEHHKEGKTGRIRFPKELRDLHRELTKDFKSNDTIITCQMTDVLNNSSLQYYDNKILDVKLGEQVHE